MPLYHGTPGGNVDKILEEGLLPFQRGLETGAFVFLSTTIEYAERSARGGKGVVFIVHGEGLDLEFLRHRRDDAIVIMVYDRAIEARYLTIVSDFRQDQYEIFYKGKANKFMQKLIKRIHLFLKRILVAVSSTLSKNTSAGFRTSDASPPATTNSPRTSYQRTLYQSLRLLAMMASGA